MSANHNSGNNSSSSRNPYRSSFSDFSLRRLLLQGARVARGSPILGCDVERGGSGNSAGGSGSSSNHPAADSHHRAGGSGGSGGGGSGASGSGREMRHERLSSAATGAVGPTVTVHASGSASGSSQRGAAAADSDATSQHSGHLSASGSPTQPLPSHSHSHSSSSSGIHTHPPSPHQLAAANGSGSVECPLCCIKCTPDDVFVLLQCKHFACRICFVRYLMIEILESRTDIACPECSQAMHPSDIQALLVHNPNTVRKYEDFMVRRVLLGDPDSRWCPAPDCSYAVIASGCASCPRIRCERPGCDINFCYHCKAEWHPDQTCDAARASRHSPISAMAAAGSLGGVGGQSDGGGGQNRDDIKPCPRCQVLIVKMDDGSCNHMVCAVCGSEFCWLCMKVISDLHYLSPSGCTFWGKKPWSRKKKLLWQLGTLVGAPVGIALVAGIAVPAMIIGIPVWVGRKVHTRYKEAGKHKRNCAVLSGVVASVMVSPILAGLAVAIGVPILLFYVYGVVPVSLCRAGCGVSTTRDGFKFDFDEEGNGNQMAASGGGGNGGNSGHGGHSGSGGSVGGGRSGGGGGSGHAAADAASADAVSRLGATSIGEVSLSVASASHMQAAVIMQQPLSGGGGGATGADGLSFGGSGGAGFGATGGGSGSTAGAISVSNVSTAALAGSITGQRMEVAVDVSGSETASAITCVSEKSSCPQKDNASTRALAGSLLNYRQTMDTSNISEDGMSERVRFDTVCHVIDARKTGSDQELCAERMSVGSCRSIRSSDRSFCGVVGGASGDDVVGDSESLSSLHKRILGVQQRLAKAQQTARILQHPSGASAGASASTPGSPSPMAAAAGRSRASGGGGSSGCSGGTASPLAAKAASTTSSAAAANCADGQRIGGHQQQEPEPECSARLNQQPAAAATGLSGSNLSRSSSPASSASQSAHGSPTSQSSMVAGGSSGSRKAAAAAAADAAPTSKSKVAILRNLFFSQTQSQPSAGSTPDV